MEVVRKEVERLAELLVRHVVPLFALDHNDRYQAVGTGFFIEHAGCHFLATAAHVFQSLPADKVLFYFVGQNQVRKVIEAPILSTSCFSDPAADKLDVAIVPLRRGGVPPYLAVNKASLPSSQLVPTTTPRSGKQYLLTGFPSSKSKPHIVRRQIESAPYGSWSSSAPPADYERLSLSADTHIVMRFDRKKSSGKDGSTVAFPHPRGMSGSPVWLVYDDDNQHNYTNFTPLVGVFIEYHRDKRTLVATDVSSILALLHEAAP